MGYYIVCIAWGSALGPLCGGFIIESMVLSSRGLGVSLTITTDAGLAWQKWISLILLVINLLWFIFFLPETRFSRATSLAAVVACTESAPAESKSDESLPDQYLEESAVEQGRTESKSLTHTWTQGLGLWSGIDSEASYINLLLRPIPLIIYPACAYAVLACELPKRVQTLSIICK